MIIALNGDMANDLSSIAGGIEMNGNDAASARWYDGWSTDLCTPTIALCGCDMQRKRSSILQRNLSRNHRLGRRIAKIRGVRHDQIATCLRPGTDPCISARAAYERREHNQKVTRFSADDPHFPASVIGTAGSMPVFSLNSVSEYVGGLFLSEPG